MRIAIILFALATVPSYALAKDCTAMEAYAAETLYSYLSSWQEVHMAFRQFGHCDSGSVAEGFDEAISRLWADQWDHLPSMLNEVSTDSAFRTFVYKRIAAETIPQDRWKKILLNAQSLCPKDGRDFCEQIISSTNAK